MYFGQLQYNIKKLVANQREKRTQRKHKHLNMTFLQTLNVHFKQLLFSITAAGFLSEMFLARNVNVFFRRKLIRNQLFCLQSPQRIQRCTLCCALTHIHNPACLLGSVDFIIPTPTQHWCRLHIQTCRLWMGIHKLFYGILIILCPGMNCKQAQFICVLPSGYSWNMKVLPPLSNLNGVFMCTHSY